MNKKTLYKTYLLPTMLQILLVAAFAGFLENAGIELGYNSVLGIFLIILAGISSAFWGIVYQVKCNGKNVIEILRDFFNFRQPIKVYTLVTTFLILDFGAVILSEGFRVESIWLPFLLFLKAIVFGGIEEIGWRYSFQPALEKKMPYVLATCITFLYWGVWHLLFFYIDGSLAVLNLPYFLLGLLTNSFILSALFSCSGSLWVCVMTHALINAFSQISVGDDGTFSIVFKVLVMGLAVFWVFKVRKDTCLICPSS